jgi:DNA polymerase III subunit epsilon
MALQLSKPLAFIDLETTGINVAKDRIIEIAIVKMMPDGSEKTYHSLVNPEMPIPQGSIDVHGITEEKVKDAPTFKQLAGDVKQFLDNCNLAGYNSNRFDIPLLYEEFVRAGVTMDLKSRKQVDVAQIFMKMEKRTLEAAYKFYCNKPLENAHSAVADVQATKEVLLAQLAHYSDLAQDVDSLHEFSKGEDFADFSRRIKLVSGVPTFNFGKYKDMSVISIFTKEPSYYDWMMKGDFAADTKQVVSEIYTKLKLKNL